MKIVKLLVWVHFRVESTGPVHESMDPIHGIVDWTRGLMDLVHESSPRVQSWFSVIPSQTCTYSGNTIMENQDWTCRLDSWTYSHIFTSIIVWLIIGSW